MIKKPIVCDPIEFAAAAALLIEVRREVIDKTTKRAITSGTRTAMKHGNEKDGYLRGLLQDRQHVKNCRGAAGTGTEDSDDDDNGNCGPSHFLLFGLKDSD